MSKEVTIKHTYKLKRGKEEALIALNPMLLDGEPIVAFMEDGSVNMKVGDGVHTYNELDWIKGDDTPTVPFIDLGYITEDEFNNALDTLTQINCVGVCRLKGPNYTAYFEQWVNMDDTSETAVTGMQFRKMYPGNGVQQRRLTSRWVGHAEYYWGEWEPLPVDITDIGNHFDSTKLDNVLDQLGNNQVIDLGTFTSNSALSGYNWEEGKYYRFYFDTDQWDLKTSGNYVGHFKCQDSDEYDIPVLYLHQYETGNNYRVELRYGNTFSIIDSYCTRRNNNGSYKTIGNVLEGIRVKLESAQSIQTFEHLQQHISDNNIYYGELFCVYLNNFKHTSGNTVADGSYICMCDYQAGIDSVVMVNLTKGIFYRLGTTSQYFTEECICEKQGQYVTSPTNYFEGRYIEDVLQQLGRNEIINLGTLSTYSDLKNIEWLDNRLYQFTVAGNSIGVPEGIYFCTSPQIDEEEDDDDDLYYDYKLRALNLQNYEWYVIKYRSDTNCITSIATISTHTTSHIKSQITYAFNEERCSNATQLYRYLHIRFYDNSYLYPHNSICRLSIKVDNNGGIYLNSTNILPRDSYRVDGTLLYEGNGYSVYKIYFTSISSGKIYYGSIDLYDKPSVVDNESRLSFTDVGIITIPDSTIVDVNDYFTNNTIEGALDELGSERIIDIGEVTSPSAIVGYSNWQEGRTYRIKYNVNGVDSFWASNERLFVLRGGSLQSLQVDEAIAELNIQLSTGTKYSIIKDTAFAFKKVGSDTLIRHKQSEAINYLRDYIDNSLIAPIQSVNTTDELQTALKAFAENNPTDYTEKPFVINLTGSFTSLYSGTGLCIGTISLGTNSYDYHFYNMSNAKTVYFQGVTGDIKGNNEKLNTLTVPSGVTDAEIEQFMINERYKDFITLAHPVNNSSTVYVNMFRGNYAEQIKINQNGVLYRRVINKTQYTDWTSIFDNPTVDSTLNINSTNAIQNKVVAQAINDINTKLNNTLSVTLTDQVTGKDYLVYVSNGQLMLEEKSEE